MYILIPYVLVVWLRICPLHAYMHTYIIGIDFPAGSDDPGRPHTRGKPHSLKELGVGVMNRYSTLHCDWVLS